MDNNTNKKDFLTAITDQIHNKAFKSSIKYEIEGHIDDYQEHFEEIGYDSKTAEKMAIEKMGEPKTIGIQLDLLHSNKAKKIIVWALILISLTIVFFRIILLMSDRSADTVLNLIYLDYAPEQVVHIAGKNIAIVSVSLFTVSFFYSIMAYFIYKITVETRSAAASFALGVLELICTFERLNSSGSLITSYSNCAIAVGNIIRIALIIFLLTNSLVSFTLSAQIHEFVKGDTNFIYYRQYEKYTKFLFAANMIIVAITLLFVATVIIK